MPMKSINPIKGVMRRLLGYGAWVLAAWAASLPLMAAEGEVPSLHRHVVQPGDTLWSLAETYLGGADRWRELQRLNDIENPYRLRPGMELLLEEGQPLLASVVHVKGQAWLVTSDGPERLLSEGMEVASGQGIHTSAHSCVALRLRDDSRVVLPSSSRVMFSGLGTRDDIRIYLDGGGVESYVSDLRQAERRYEVVTPVGIIGVRGTHFRVSMQADEGVTTSVLKGGVAIRRGDQVLGEVGAGDGVRLGQNGGLTKVELLPPPEVLTEWQGAEGIMQARVAGVAGAQEYRLQLARDPEFQAIVRDGRSVAGEFAFEELPGGAYHVRVTAIDALGVEGRPGRHMLFYRALGGTDGSGH